MTTSIDANTQRQLASTLRSLHVPGRPLLLTNVWDAPTAKMALSDPRTKVIATASFAIAAVAGLDDADLTKSDNILAISKIAAQMRKGPRSKEVPLTVDLQDGYGEELEAAVAEVIALGAVGINLEDSNTVGGVMRLEDVDEQIRRIRCVLTVARQHGLHDFVVNARTDCVLLGHNVEEAVERGKKYLAAGATTIFVWGGMKRGLRDSEVKQLVQGLGGMVNVIYRKSMDNALTPKEIAQLGVARISLGPGLWREGMAAVQNEMSRILGEV